MAFRQHTLLPVHDSRNVLQPTIPHLTRCSLHRSLQRQSISRLPEVEGDKPKKRHFKCYPTGFLHIGIAELRTAEGKLSLFVAIDQTSKFTVARWSRRRTARQPGSSLSVSSTPCLTGSTRS